VSISKARELLRKAERAKSGLRQNLLLAAALSEVIAPPPVVVGGTAEEFWGGHEYHETDLDLVSRITSDDRATLESLGFERRGREWIRAGTPFVIAFPDTRIDGDDERIHTTRVGGGSVRIIGLDDLYVDRLKQATTNEPREDIHFQSALAVAASRYDDINWTYVSSRIEATQRSEPLNGQAMRRVNSRIRSRARRALSRNAES
jgi:hypothetical protein